jgi:hypothetical protein
MENPSDTSSREIELGLEKLENVSQGHGPRDHIPSWQWILICVGLYLGALLYGIQSFVTGSLKPKIILIFPTRSRYYNCG